MFWMPPSLRGGFQHVICLSSSLSTPFAPECFRAFSSYKVVTFMNSDQNSKLRFQVLMAASIKMTAFWDIASCSQKAVIFKTAHVLAEFHISLENITFSGVTLLYSMT
jgi:hypothetical protein